MLSPQTLLIKNNFQLKGIINAPCSKSSMQRACALSLLHQGTTIIKNPGKSNDDLAALNHLKQLGLKILSNDKQSIVIDNSTDILLTLKNGQFNGNINFDCGESGLGIRMFTPLLALNPHEISISGKGSLQKRPLHFFEQSLTQLGKFVATNNGFVPIKLKNALVQQSITIDGSESSQYLTGLLMLWAFLKNTGHCIYVNNLQSKPYIDLTLQILSEFGYSFENQNYQLFRLNGYDVERIAKTISYTNESDWSGSAFLIVLACFFNHITICELTLNSVQADKAILTCLDLAGIKYQINSQNVFQIISVDNAQGFHFDASDCPDLFPPLVSLASKLSSPSKIKGVHRLTHKESNRALTLQQEFAKINVGIDFQNDEMIITPPKNPTNISKIVNFESHYDHRIAMAVAVAAISLGIQFTIKNAEAVNKSYPLFFEDIKKVGVAIGEL